MKDAETGVYVYGVVDGRFDKELENKGIDGGGVYFLVYKDITAVVSDTLFEEYDPDDENMLTHDNVLREILGDNKTIAPMRFCTILKTRDDVFKLLQAGYMEFRKNLLRVRDKEEFAIKVFLDFEKFSERFSEDSITDKSREIASELYEKLKKISVDNILDEQITDDMMLNASFLLNKNVVKEFRNLITEFDKQYTDVLKIRISGPLAPYNFVSMPES
jgi:hypothetical protein